MSLKCIWSHGRWIGIPVMIALAGGGAALADTLPDEDAAYGLDFAPGLGTARVGIVFDQVGSNFVAKYNEMRADLGLAPCTSCQIIGTTSGNANQKEALATALSVTLASPDAPITVIAPASRSSADLLSAMRTLYAQPSLGGVVLAFGPAAADQATATALIGAHASIPVAAPAGQFASPLVIQTGATQRVAGVETLWSTQSVTPDIAALGHGILLPDGSVVDSIVASSGTVIGAGMTRAEILGGPASEFDPLVGVTRGAFDFRP